MTQKPDAQSTYQPRPPDLHSIAAARQRIQQLLADAPAGLPLARLLPAARESPPESRYRRVSAWSSTFVAGLELAKQGDVTLDQEDAFGPMTVRPAVISIPA